MSIKNYRLIFAIAPLAAGMLLSGCSGSASKDAPQASASAKPAPEVAAKYESATSTKEDRPGKAVGEVIVVNAKVKAIDSKNRIVTLQYPDGNEDKVQCGPEVRNFPQIRVGDDVAAKFIESAELFVTGADEPAAGHSTEVARAPKGSKPGFAAIDAVEVKASVVSIDYQTRDVTLKGPEGKLVTIKAGPEVKRLNEVKQGDTVVARLVRAMSIEVSKPVE